MDGDRRGPKLVVRVREIAPCEGGPVYFHTTSFVILESEFIEDIQEFFGDRSFNRLAQPPAGAEEEPIDFEYLILPDEKVHISLGA